MAGNRSKGGFPPWVSANPGKKEGFVSITYSMFEHEAFRNLSPMEIKIYLNMRKAAGRYQEFTFPKSAWKDICAASTYNSIEKKLIAKGFIEKTMSGKNLRRPNVYKLSFKWHSV